MRKIKFRAWDKKRKEWVYIIFSHVQFVYMSHEDGVYEQWQQFTGLHDKNSKEIYEGDIVRQLGEVVVVEWKEELGDAGALYGSGWPIFGGRNAEVIGNIYETPELLTQSAV